MIDGNTAALNKKMNDDDQHCRIMRDYYGKAWAQEKERILQDRRADVVDLFLDDPTTWIDEAENIDFYEALLSGDTKRMGETLENVLGVCAYELVDEDRVIELAYEMDREAGGGL